VHQTHPPNCILPSKPRLFRLSLLRNPFFAETSGHVSELPLALKRALVEEAEPAHTQIVNKKTYWSSNSTSSDSLP
jgi:hypothetical protein